MPTKEYQSADAAWQSLTDLELEDDSRDYPCAIVPIRGVGKIKIEMLSEWDYFSVFLPMRQKFITYYANKLLADENIKNKDVILEKVQAFQNDISAMKETGKSETLTYLFSDVEARYTFFKDMKKMGMIPRFCSWKRWQKHARPLDTMTVFAFLWLFNVDGLKKKRKIADGPDISGYDYGITHRIESLHRLGFIQKSPCAGARSVVRQLRELKHLRCDLHALRVAEQMDVEEYNREIQKRVEESSKSLSGALALGRKKGI